MFENYLLKYGIIKSKSSSQDKNLIQEGYEILRSQVNNLAKLKHPNILTLIEPLEEHSKNFLFVTEYVTGSLESIFKTDQQQNDDADEQDFFKGHVKDQIVIRRGILQLVNGLDFIHNKVHCVHLDIQPKSIFINENSDWKISGLGHLFKLPSGSNTSEHFLPQYDPRIPSFMQLQYDYTAPEIIFDNTVTCKNDYFSLGLLINFLYTGENNLIRSENSSSQYKDEYKKFEKKISSMSWDNVFPKLPNQLKACIPKLMNRDIYSRYDNITDFLETEFFQDPLIKTLNFLDDLPTKSNQEKLVFLDGLIELLPQFPVALLQKKFLPILLGLLDQLCADKNIDQGCISRDLQIILKIGSSLSQLSFHEKVYPVLTNKTNFPILLNSSTDSLIDNISILKEKIKLSEFLDSFMKPLLKYVLNNFEGENSITSQEKLLSQLPLILDCLDFPEVKNFLLPLIANLFTKTTSLTIKVTIITCFKTLIEHKSVDAYVFCEEVLPLFKSMKTRDPRILMTSLTLFETIPQIVSDEVILVEQLLPLMWNYSMASTLKANQYTAFTKVINKFSSDIQNRHIQKLGNSTDLNGLNKEGAFNKIIDTPVVKKTPDLETQQAKNISTPAIRPTRNNMLPKASLPIQPLSRNPLPLSNKTLPVKSPDFDHHFANNGSVNPLTGSRSSAHTRQGQSQVYTPKNATTDTFDDFDTFVSASSTPQTTNRVTPMQQPLKPNTISPAPGNFPPGFSIPLQPNRKDANPSSSSFDINSDSLI